jgi:dTDP-4-amino-4,6-dideoxygalactose transaminase
VIPFNIPAVTGKEETYIKKVFENQKFSGDGMFTQQCHSWIENKFRTKKALLTTSCTHALEMAAILADIKDGDEVIMPSYTFVSTANAFVLRGAKIVFVDIRPDTMNLDEQLIEAAITSRTKAIVPVHYAGVSCDMEKIMVLAAKYDLIVIEDAAQAVMSKYNGKHLGSIGHMGCFSFHETKNYNCGEGGALLINDVKYLERAEIIREKGTNRSRFYRGEIDKYTWVDIGSSYLPSEINAACLYAQLEMAEDINNDRLKNWNLYLEELKDLEQQEKIVLPRIPTGCEHNGHMFYIKTKDIEERTNMIDFLKKNNISGVFHYVPLHTSEAGRKFGYFHGYDMFTTQESEKLLRLPLFFNLTEDKVKFIKKTICNFYQ